MKFSNFYVPGVGLLTPCSVLRDGFLYIMIVPGGGGGFLLSSRRAPGGWFWMKSIPALLYFAREMMLHAKSFFRPHFILIKIKFIKFREIKGNHCKFHQLW